MAALTAAVVLAAGASSRLGRPKQLLTYRGVTLLRHAIDCAIEGGCDPVLVVLGSAADRLVRELAGVDVTIVVNEHWQRGLASSIHAGVVAAQAFRPEPAAVLLTTCDQPRLTADVIRELRQPVETGRARLAACSYAGTIGVPAAFDRSLIAELLELSGSGGAKPILERYRGDATLVEWSEGAVDVDTPGDVDALRRD